MGEKVTMPLKERVGLESIPVDEGIERLAHIFYLDSDWIPAGGVALCGHRNQVPHAGDDVRPGRVCVECDRLDEGEGPGAL